MKKLSIIIPLYNAEKYIARCLESAILSAGDLDYEIIVVDDGSTDNGPLIVQNLSISNDSIKLIRKTNGGASSARNKGIEYAKGKYIYFIDSDDYIKPGALKHCIDIIDEIGGEILHFSYQMIDEHSCECTRAANHDVEPYPNWRIISNLDFFKQILIPNGDWTHVDNIISLEFLKKNNLVFDEKAHGDEDLLFDLNLFYNAKKVIIVDATYYYYVIREGSVTTKLDPIFRKSFNDNRVYIFEKLKDFLDLKNLKSNPFVHHGITLILDTHLFKYIIDLIKYNYSGKEIRSNLLYLKNKGIYPLGKFPDIKSYNYNNSWRFKILWLLFNNIFMVILLSKVYKTLK